MDITLLLEVVFTCGTSVVTSGLLCLCAVHYPPGELKLYCFCRGIRVVEIHFVLTTTTRVSTLLPYEHKQIYSLCPFVVKSPQTLWSDWTAQ